MKVSICLLGPAALFSATCFGAGQDEPELAELLALVGKKENHPPLVAFMENHKFWEKHQGGRAWESSYGITVALGQGTVRIGIRPPSDATRQTVYKGELPKGLSARDSDADIVKKLGKPQRSNDAPGVYRQLIYDGMVVHTAGGELFDLWLIPPGKGKDVADSPLVAVANGLAKIAKEFEFEQEVGVDPDGRSVSVSNRTRKFMVHSGGKTGKPPKEVREVVGPDADGCRIKVYLQEGRYAGAAAIPQNLRRPHWTTFINAYPVAGGRQHLFLSFSSGARTDPELLEKVNGLLSTLADRPR